MAFIRYHEVEKLFIAWPQLEAILENLSLDINAARTRDSMGTSDEYIYTMAIGNKALSDMPPAGKISDSTGNIAANYHKLMYGDRKSVKKEIGTGILEITLILSKLEIAYRRLTFFQRRILQLYYWKCLSWKDIAELIKNDRIYYSTQQIQELRRQGIKKMTGVLTVTIEAYESIMKLLE